MSLVFFVAKILQLSPIVDTWAFAFGLKFDDGGSKIYIEGNGWDQDKMGRDPTKEDLAACIPARPAFIRRRLADGPSVALSWCH